MAISSLFDLDIDEPIFGSPSRSAGSSLSGFSTLRNELGINRPQNRPIGQVIERNLLEPEESPGFKLAQNLLVDRSEKRKGDLETIVERAGLGASGPALKSLDIIERGTDVELGNLALEAADTAEKRALEFEPLVQNTFLKELELAMIEADRAKGREFKREELKNLATLSLGASAGSVLGKASPTLIDKLFDLILPIGATALGAGATTGLNLSSVDAALKAAGVDISNVGEFGKTIFPDVAPEELPLSAPQLTAEGAGTILGSDLGVQSIADLAAISPSAAAAEEVISGGAAASALGAEAGTESLFSLGGLGALSIPLGIFGISSLFFGDAAKKEKKKASRYTFAYRDLARDNPDQYLADIESQLGSTGRDLGQKALDGTLTAGKAADALGLNADEFISNFGGWTVQYHDDGTESDKLVSPDWRDAKIGPVAWYSTVTGGSYSPENLAEFRSPQGAAMRTGRTLDLPITDFDTGDISLLPHRFNINTGEFELVPPERENQE